MKEAAATIVVGAFRERVVSDGQIRGTGKKGGLAGFGWPHSCLFASSNPYSKHKMTSMQRRNPALILTEIRRTICYKA